MFEIIAKDQYGFNLYKAFTMETMVDICVKEAEEAAREYTTACYFRGEKEFYAKVIIREGSREWTKLVH